MVELGYHLSSEEHAPLDLVRHARLAEEAGFRFALISDHLHPWTDRQGQSPFVWSVLGALAQALGRLRLGTGVTCPIMRTPPWLVAHAAATMGALLPGRFLLGLGTGENLNEHVLGEGWPPAAVRSAMLEEAIEVIRLLWTGELCSHEGTFYRVEEMRLYTRPASPPPILVAASSEGTARLAGRLGDGLIAVEPAPALVEAFEDAGGRGKPRYGKVTVCWAPTEAEALETARTWWPVAVLPPVLMSELRLPAQFEAAARKVRDEDLAEALVLGPDPRRHAERIDAFARSGFTHVYVHQVGPEQHGCLDFYAREILPRLGGAP
jgi:G6PDH family F420-dependent oxidoreductase